MVLEKAFGEKMGWKKVGRWVGKRRGDRLGGGKGAMMGREKER
jgi:hypothetical protein